MPISKFPETVHGITDSRSVPSRLMGLEAESAIITAVGDISPGDHYLSLGHGMMSRTARGTLNNLFSEAAPILCSADISLCNLEGPLSHRTNQQSPVESAAFRGLPPFCELLKRAGFTHINIANNHIAQHGPAAFDDTLDALREHKLSIVGLDGRREGYISLPVISSVRGKTICSVGYSAVQEKYSDVPPRYAYFTDYHRVASEVRSLSRKYDNVIVMCHSGDEGMAHPSSSLVVMYRALVDAGARCVFGHHPHVFQPIERYRNGLIAYSLGDFAFGLFWDLSTIRSAILEARMMPNAVVPRLFPMEFSADYRVRAISAKISMQFIQTVDQGLPIESLEVEQYANMLTAYERKSRYAKGRYFIANLMRGGTGKKVAFLASKISRRWLWARHRAL